MIEPPAQQAVEQVVDVSVAEDEEKLYLGYVAGLFRKFVPEHPFPCCNVESKPHAQLLPHHFHVPGVKFVADLCRKPCHIRNVTGSAIAVQ